MSCLYDLREANPDRYELIEDILRAAFPRSTRSARLGRRNYFLLSIGVFTFASALCGIATSLWQIILARILQGLAGGDAGQPLDIGTYGHQ